MQTNETGPQSPGGALAEEIDEASRQLELADPDAALGPVDRFVNRIAEIMGVALFAAITVLIFANAVLRYTTQHSIVWAEEVVIGLTPWLAMVGVFLAVRRGTMIRIDYFYEKLPAAVAGPLVLLGQIWCAVVFAYMAWLSFQYLSFFGGDPTPVLDLPKGIFASALVVGSVAAALAFLAEAWLRRRPPPAVGTAPELRRGGPQ
ncbi:MAG TPA: TRAP transporter small permease [Afifellaceae bacterium]|nr:TRAP transporter small permease [Afifellaceae bacterium]